MGVFIFVSGVYPFILFLVPVSFAPTQISKSQYKHNRNKKDMSPIKHKFSSSSRSGEPNRSTSCKLPAHRQENCQRLYKCSKRNGWNFLEIDDSELKRMFHTGSPAYTSRKMEISCLR